VSVARFTAILPEWALLSPPPYPRGRCGTGPDRARPRPVAAL